MSYATTEHIKNLAAANFIIGLREEFSGLNKVYGSRYMTQLEKVCGYRGSPECDHIRKADDTRRGGFKIVFKHYYILNISGVRKEFKSSKEAGLFMEAKINDMFDMGIM